ncbi:FUSC family protein, partial [Coxiella burnetii]
MSALYNALNIKLKRLSKERVIASFKTALACLIGLIIGELLHLSMPQWVLITIVVVMATTIRIGGTIQKSYFRLLGTLIGAVLAAGTLYLLGDQPTIIHILLILLLAVFSYLASSSSDISQFGLLGATTMVMILDARTPTLKTALDRTLEIFLGIVIAILVTRFIFPAHAKKLLRFSIANTIKQFQALYKLFVTHKLTKESLAEQEKIENNIITDVSKQ